MVEIRTKGLTRTYTRQRRLIIVLLTLATAGLIFGPVRLQHGSLKLPGLSKPVEIVRDNYQVPHVFAESVNDAYFALGFLHAKDRLWQMELNRRAGSGQLAEIFGSKALEQDRFYRTLGLRRAAEANLQQLDEPTVTRLNAYARGVNAGLDQTDFLPVEFYFFGVKPKPWQPVDSLVWLKTMAWQLSGNWWEELLNLSLRQRLSPEQFNDLFPAYPGDELQPLPDTANRYASLAPLVAKLLVQHKAEAGKSIGSNNWVVDGSRSASGKPLLANDPHLPLTAPSIWYFAHLHAPGLNAIGATLPGVPGIVLGHNEKVAWAFTNTGPDSQDVFLEKIPPGLPSHYMTPSGAEAFDEISETIKVKDEADQLLTIRVSRHGPVISDADDHARQAAPDGMAAALSWTGLRPDDATIRFMLNAGFAQTAAELKETARDFHAPQQNIVYADIAGAIGFVAAGRVPVRSAANRLKGRLPAPGWLAAYDWQGFIPFGHLPQQTGSDSGAIVTANQKITPQDYPYWITGDWALPYRAERISALLDRQNLHDVASFAAIQNDVVNPVAAQLLPYLLHIEADGRTVSALTLMKQWDMRMQENAAQPLIFAEWIRQLAALLYKRKLGDLYDSVGDYNPRFLFNVLRDEHGSAGRWCRPAQAGAAWCAAEIKQALRAALVNIKRNEGSDPSRWRWGHSHVTVFKHQPLGQIPVLGKLFNIESESPGGMDTINVSGYRYEPESGRYVGEAGAAFRAIYDLSGPDRSVFTLGTGQSGSPLSPHYRNMTRGWRQGGYVPLLTTRQRIQREAAEQLTLMPG